MAKILLTIISFLILAFIVVAMYCALVIAGRSDENDNNDEDDDEMFCKKQICPSCKTGKYTYDLDKLSENCPYIGCLKNGKCKFYIPF